MACRLIVNADDFGLTQGVNRAIAELYRAGVITSTTLMATGAAFTDAARLAASLPGLGVGCHVVLVDGSPLSPLSKIQGLLGADRRTFRPTLAGFLRDLLLGRIRKEEIALEAEAQIRRLQNSGILVTHVDTHKHTHMFPRVTQALLLAAQRCGVTALRNPFEPAWSAALSEDHASRVRLLQLSFLHRFEPSFRQLLPPAATSVTTNGTLGIAATGSLDPPVLRRMLDATIAHAAENAVYELVCHPGYNDEDLGRANTRLLHHREEERRALLKEVPTYRNLPDSPALIHYGDLRKQKGQSKD